MTVETESLKKALAGYAAQAQQAAAGQAKIIPTPRRKHMDIKIEQIDNGFIIDLPCGPPSLNDPFGGAPAQRVFAHDTIDLIGRISEYLQDRYKGT